MTSVAVEAKVRGDDGCGVCQSLQGIPVGAVGQDLTHIATEAASGKTGLSTRKYMTEFIEDAQAPVF